MKTQSIFSYSLRLSKCEYICSFYRINSIKSANEAIGTIVYVFISPSLFFICYLFRSYIRSDNTHTLESLVYSFGHFWSEDAFFPFCLHRRHRHNHHHQHDCRCSCRCRCLILQIIAHLQFNPTSNTIFNPI